MSFRVWLGYDSEKHVFQGFLSCNCYIHSLDPAFEEAEWREDVLEECSCDVDQHYLFTLDKDSSRITWYKKGEPEIRKDVCRGCGGKKEFIKEEEIMCSKCDGNGWVLGENTDVEICSACDGHKNISSRTSSACGDCNGLGFHPKVVVQRFGRIECPTCEGGGALSEDYVSMDFLNSQTCERCRGDGLVTCEGNRPISKKDWRASTLAKSLKDFLPPIHIEREDIEIVDKFIMKDPVFGDLMDYEINEIEITPHPIICNCVSPYENYENSVDGLDGEGLERIRGEADASCSLCSGTGFCFNIFLKRSCPGCMGTDVPCENCNGYGYLFVKSISD
ncbi:hypothetical protein OAF32_02165 [Akkermansiaceae bacterium]|nr:hypothetical protein [Akkermansiaceae bacterium]